MKKKAAPWFERLCSYYYLRFLGPYLEKGKDSESPYRQATAGVVSSFGEFVVEPTRTLLLKGRNQKQIESLGGPEHRSVASS